MDYSTQFRREASGELTLKPSPEAAALATAYRKNPTGTLVAAARVKEEAIIGWQQLEVTRPITSLC